MSNAGRSWPRFAKFNLVGLLGAALQMFLLWLLIKRFQVSALAATPVAVEIVVLHNLAWHERLTWRDRPAKNLRQKMVRLWRFHAGNGLTSLLGNTAVIYGLVQWIHAPLVPSAIAAIVLCSLVNFLVADGWAFATIADSHSGANSSEGEARCSAAPSDDPDDHRRNGIPESYAIGPESRAVRK
jgi:putative flippase GtrA